MNASAGAVASASRLCVSLDLFGGPAVLPYDPRQQQKAEIDQDHLLGKQQVDQPAVPRGGDSVPALAVRLTESPSSSPRVKHTLQVCSFAQTLMFSLSIFNVHR
jgi:hypothetical protein